MRAAATGRLLKPANFQPRPPVAGRRS